ncbi:MAG: hypothetical protein JW841_00035, partial [Deltaproteobacteria bacterium]|nr:hypothetical protein [Deltaproteobacteria bacterium]
QNSLENEINQKQELQNSLENEINQKQELQDALQQNQKDIGSKNTQIKVLQEETNELRLALEKMQNDIATSQITNNDKSDAINVTETLDNNTDLTLKDTSTISSEEEVVSDELDLVENESTTPVLLDDNANSSIDEEEFSEAVLPLSTSDNVPSNETVSSIELDTEVPNEASVTVNDPAFAQAPEEIENLDAQALLDTAQKNSLDVLYVEDIGETQVLEQNDDTVLNNENTFDEPMFGELKVGSDTVATKKQNPSTLDDLEDLLADSIPKPPSQR